MQKKYLNGKTWFPLTVQKEILAMRKEIENNSQHAGQKFELVLQAYNEIRDAQGLQKSKYTPSCSGCTLGMNVVVSNWLKLYDQLGVSEQRVIKAPKFKPLTPIEPSAEPSYKELLDKFNSLATDDEKKIIRGNGKTPSKSKLIEYFNGK